MRNHRFLLDSNDLQFKQITYSKKKKFLKYGLFFILSVIVAIGYGYLFERFYGSPKEEKLSQEIESLKLQFSVANKNLDNQLFAIRDLQTSDEITYRPILQMDGLPETYRNPGVGGVERYSDLNGYSTSNIMKSTRSRIDVMKMMLDVQEESLSEMVSRESEWETMLEHIPSICPVLVTIRKGDGLMLRQIHPILGVTRYHNGLDLKAPIGTEVYAPGDGQVILAGNNGGYGKCVIIDHGYGYKTIYGHLSSYNVVVGQNVKRGDLICLTGNTGISTGPHLHYEIRQFDKVKNPVNYMHDNISEEEYEEMISSLSASSE